MLEQLLNELEQKLPEYEKTGMQPGASDIELSNIEKQISPCLFTSELRALYSWHNGSLTEFLPEIPIFTFEFHNIKECIETLNFLKSNQICDNWPMALLPIGDMDGSIFLATLTDKNKECSQIIQYFFDDGSAYLMHENIASMLQCAIFVLSNEGKQNDSFDDVRLRFSPSAYPASSEFILG